MLTKRIIACLDVMNGKVVKGVKFQNHEIIGDIVEMAKDYSDQGVDELVFYDITASVENRSACPEWVKQIAKEISIPFCVAGGIRTEKTAKDILYAGADKISINTPAIENPRLIENLASKFGSQCIVIGIDSKWVQQDYYINKYTGSPEHTKQAGIKTMDWIKEVQNLGAGEIVLNCMSSDGTKEGYDIKQLKLARDICRIPMIASGGAGKIAHFIEVFQQTNVDGALAASVFHKNIISLNELKEAMKQQKIPVRL